LPSGFADTFVAALGVFLAAVAFFLDFGMAGATSGFCGNALPSGGILRFRFGNWRGWRQLGCRVRECGFFLQVLAGAEKCKSKNQNSHFPAVPNGLRRKVEIMASSPGLMSVFRFRSA
jgi:hypothetical protein